MALWAAAVPPGRKPQAPLLAPPQGLAISEVDLILVLVN